MGDTNIYLREEASVEVQRPGKSADKPALPPNYPSLSPYFLSTTEIGLHLGVELFSSLIVCLEWEALLLLI
jgi:hypothetical protein